MTILVIGVLVVVLAGLVLLAATLLLAASQAAERLRIEREAEQASWNIHQQASAAFGQLLDAARSEQEQERGR